ncbi:MAG: PTS sugar transporter subunit IIA [Alphaproteobacteria bacterium]|nr:PTS sugar transporter subunit IIA [Alphaproteobacteria bacterium]
MNISDIVTEKCVLVGLRSNNKREFLQDLANQISNNVELDSRTIFDTFLERENLGSTGFGGGTALPHGRFAGLDKVYAVLAKPSSPLDFDAIDGKPVDIVFALLSPENSGADHLTALAKLSRILKDESLVSKLRQMHRPVEIYAILNNHE